MTDPPGATAAVVVAPGSEKGVRLAHAFLWKYSYKRLKLAQLLGHESKK
jgi:hypothetical protein